MSEVTPRDARIVSNRTSDCSHTVKADFSDVERSDIAFNVGQIQADGFEVISVSFEKEEILFGKDL